MLIRSAETRAPGGHGREEYTYTAGQLTRIDTWHDDRPQASISISYDARGNLEHIESTWLQGRRHTETTYRRPPDGWSLTGQSATVVDLLVAHLPLVVAAADIDEPAYCVALAYGDASCLPRVAIGLEGERQEWLTAGDEEFPWNFVEFQHYDREWHEHVDQAFLDATDLLDQEMALAGEMHRIRDVLLDVARQSNRRDWRSTLPITEDFLVYPVDYELVDLEANLAAVRP